MQQILLLEQNRYLMLSAQDKTILDSALQPCPEEKGALRIEPGAQPENAPSLNGTPMTPFQTVKVAGKTAVLFAGEGERYSLVNHRTVRIGKDDNCDVVPAESDIAAYLSGDSLEVREGSIYLNGHRAVPGIYSLQQGDCLLLGFKLLLTYQRDTLVLYGTDYTCRLKNALPIRAEMEEFPVYKRAPRLIIEKPEDKIEVSPPPQKEKKRRGQLLRRVLPPLVMVCATVTIGVLMGRGIYMFVSAIAMGMTVIFSISGFFGDRKESREKETERVENYENYLLNKRKQIYKIYNQNREALQYHNPSLKEIEQQVQNYSSRIYEHAATDNDFLCLSLGTAAVEPSFTLSMRKDEMNPGKDPMLKEAEDIVAQFKKLDDMPIVIDLKNAHLGIVGEKQNVQTQLQALIAELCFAQSYHDIEVITIIAPEDFPQFSWIRWYPHCKVKSINVYGLIHSENQRDQVLGNLAQILKARKQQTEESKRDSLYLPHYVFVIDNAKLIVNHSIMEFLMDAESTLGFSAIYTTNHRANLPENIKTILELDGSQHGTLLMNEGKVVRQEVKTHSLDGIDLETMARRLAPLRHNQGVTTHIPDSITFFEMYGVQRPEQLPVLDFWQKNAPHKSLAVPLGVRAEDDIVYLNLHEKAHGPHGLVAGTTGSGKSEILQSFILSLAINFHPYDVGFLLIDYKGGGMANLFNDLPHLLGTITNLDGSESLRALASIKSELARRQRIFNENGVNSINQYTALFKAGEATCPLPHLFLISDEFAELKKEQPDFMSELVSTARIGRSLGVHLILATQKPSGVVDDQIWSNSKFKLALKVQDEADSKEVLKTPDAARITQPGRAYLQVGNNEIYEMFQSAWSGADYSEETVKQGFDGRVYLLNALGQGQLLNQDLSELEEEKASKLSQLDVTVEYVKQCYEGLHAVPVDKPWLPPLAEQIVSPHIKVDGDVGKIEGYNLSVAVGIVDIPEEQKQIEYVHDFIKDGNLVIFGASGFGKSTVEMNLVLSLAMQNSPQNVQFFIMDLGNAALVQLRGLPHTADYLSFDDNEKLQKLVKLMNEEMRQRKQQFAAVNALNFTMYNAVAAEQLPAIVLLVDNYDVVKEIGFELEEFFTKLTRDGPGVGIFTVLTATRSNAIRYAVQNNFKHKLAQFMADPMEVSSIVGRSSYKLPEMRGRALVKLPSGISMMQCYLPAAFENDVAYANLIRDFVEGVSAKNTAEEAEGIKMLPEILTIPLLEKYAKAKESMIPIGVSAGEVEGQYIDASIPLHLIVGSPQTGKTNLLKLVQRHCAAEHLFIADSQALEFFEQAENDGVTYMNGSAQAEAFVQELEDIVDAREAQFQAEGAGQRPRVFYASLPRVMILIDDGEYFVESCKGVEKQLEQALSKAFITGVCVVCTALPGKLRGYDSISKMLKDTQYGVVLGNPNDQTLLMLQAPRGYKQQIDMGFLYRRGEGILMKVPKAVQEQVRVV